MYCSEKPDRNRMRRGLSLIEILVVIVVLLVGILAVIRLFPAGFLSIRTAQNSTTADRIGESLLESFRANESVPDGIYASVLTQSGTLGFDPTVNPDDLLGYQNAYGTTAYDRYGSDLNKSRYIYREPAVVSTAIVQGGAVTNPVYVPKFGPLFLPTTAPPSGTTLNAAEFLTVDSDYWKVIPGNWQSATMLPSDVLTPGQPNFLVDYSGGKIAVAPEPYVQYFRITFHVTNTANPESPVTTLNLKIPAQSANGGVNTSSNYNGGWFSPANTSLAYYTDSPLPTGINGSTGPNPWDVGTVKMYRPFRQLDLTATNVKFDSDPYEFALVNQVNIASTDANVGSLYFNPLAAGQNALRCFVSYLAFDWHILHEDHTISPDTQANGDASCTINLAITGIRKVGDVLSDQSAYASLMPFQTGVTPGAKDAMDIMLVDLDTGQQIPGFDSTAVYDEDYGTPNGLNTSQTQYLSVSYKNGRVTINDTASFFATHKRIRVYYSGVADWGVALQKASTQYFPTSNVADLTTVPLATIPNEFYEDATSQYVYFPICDENKSVHFSNVLYQDANGQYHRSDFDDSLSKLATPTGGTTPLPYIDVAAHLGSTTTTTGRYTNAYVAGVSARAIVIWREKGNWRQRDVDTVLGEPK